MMEWGPWNKVDIIEISLFNEQVLLHVKINRKNMVSYVYSFHTQKLQKKEKNTYSELKEYNIVVSLAEFFFYSSRLIWPDPRACASLLSL